MTELPPGVRTMAARGPQWERWVDGLPAVVRSHLAQWELRTDGAATHGSSSIVVPVRTPEDVPAVLKVGFPDGDSEHGHLVLRRWAGEGSVRLLRADPRHRSMVLERLHPQSLATLTDVEACEVVAGIYRRIHVPALPQLRSLTSCVEQWTREFAELPRSAPIPRRLIEQAMALGSDLSVDTGDGGRVLHGDLHYANVLAAEREPWLTIAPKPMNGDPHYELAPLLWHRWDELAGHVRDGVRYRFHSLIDATGLDEERARAWVIVRVVHEATRELSSQPSLDTTRLTRYVALAKAVQD
ncbi:MAG: aminoglycoside phosphotransferase family protein [Mycobacterium sp.]